MFVYKIAKSQKRDWMESSGKKRYPRTPDCILVGHETLYTKEQLHTICLETLSNCMPVLIQDYLLRLGEYIMGKTPYTPHKVIWPEVLVPILCQHLIADRGFVSIEKAEEVSFGYGLAFDTDKKKQGKQPSIKYPVKWLEWLLQKAWIERKVSTIEQIADEKDDI
jgi:hypothetical protein